MRQAVEAGCIGEVLFGAHPLEEARLDRHAVHESSHGTCIRERVVSKDSRGSSVLQEQRREQPDERRLARAVAAEDRYTLAAGDGERDAVQRRHPPTSRKPSVRANPPPELLAQVARLDRRRLTISGRGACPAGCCKGHGCSLERERTESNGFVRAPRRRANLQVPGADDPDRAGKARAGAAHHAIHVQQHDDSRITGERPQPQSPTSETSAITPVSNAPRPVTVPGPTGWGAVRPQW